MSNTISDLFLSDMTLLVPSQDERNVNENNLDIAPYSWDQRDYDSRLNKKNQGNVEASFIESLPAFYPRSRSSYGREAELENVDTVETHAPQRYVPNRKQGGSNWYNYFQTINDEKFEWVSQVSSEELYNETPRKVPRVKRKSVDENLLPGELSVKELSVHPKILTGFKYCVRQVDSNKYLFDGAALKLVSIGRGYGKRITFESDSAIHNDNFFYSDTHPAGYGFQLQAVEEGQKFTLRDDSNNALGFCTIAAVKSQLEISQEVSSDRKVEKRVKVTFTCGLEKFDNIHHGEEYRTIEGVAVLLREKSNGAAILTKIIECTVDGEAVGFTLVPGVDEKERVSFVSSEGPGEISASYIISGLQPHELPVISTYIHPNIMVGAKYKVRNLSTGKYLFDQRALTLQSIGKGYGKRITFASDSFIHNDNYFYSDTSECGFGFTLEALSVGDQFRIVNADTNVEMGTVEICRADVEQQQLTSDCLGEARANVKVSCNLTVFGDTFTSQITGQAVIKKLKSKLSVSVTNVSFVGVQSSICHDRLVFLPM